MLDQQSAAQQPMNEEGLAKIDQGIVTLKRWMTGDGIRPLILPNGWPWPIQYLIDLRAEIDRLRAEIAALKATRSDPDNQEFYKRGYQS